MGPWTKGLFLEAITAANGTVKNYDGKLVKNSDKKWRSENPMVRNEELFDKILFARLCRTEIQFSLGDKRRQSFGPEVGAAAGTAVFLSVSRGVAAGNNEEWRKNKHPCGRRWRSLQPHRSAYALPNSAKCAPVRGVVQDLSGKTTATILGKWDESMHYVHGDPGRKGKGAETLPQAQMLWKRSKPPKNPTRYNLTRFGITLNELTPGLKVNSYFLSLIDSQSFKMKNMFLPFTLLIYFFIDFAYQEKLPPTDSRLRPDQRCLENGEFDMANAEKLRLEQRQRQARTMQESGWKPRWFSKDEGRDTYRYVGGYWEAREKGQWDDCPNIFGQVPADPLPD
ncbi:Oxysterol-binding protein-related protein 1C [Platanthera guangdongensis]|uniref:Oxysterol-binding protein-related protein 1C n=1 Tax=Platanthera guangdongensis TaxID=2320717 RepID=A0ABR2MTE2_9ASPA